MKKIVLLALISMPFFLMGSMGFVRRSMEVTVSTKHILLIDANRKYAFFGWYRASQMSPAGWELLQRTVDWAIDYQTANQTDVVLFTYNGDVDPPVDHSEEDGYAVYLWLVDQRYNVTVHHQSDSETLPPTYYYDYDLVIYWCGGGRDGTNIVISGIPFITVGYRHTDEMGIGTGLSTMHEVEDTFYVVNNSCYPTQEYPLGLLEFESPMWTDATEAADNGTVLVQAEMPSALSVHNVETGLDYATIQEAIDASETLDGHTLRVHAAKYCENIVVSKSLSLVGEGGDITIIDGNVTGPVMNVTANGVKITGFRIRHSDHGDCGIFISSSGNNISYNTVVTNSYGIELYYSSDNIISGNEIVDNDVGVRFEFSSTNNTVSQNTITSNGRYGISLDSSSQNSFSGNNIRNNDVGIELYYSSDNIISGNEITASNKQGIYLRYSSTNNSITDNTIINNKYGCQLLNASDNSIFHNNFVDNINQAYIDPEYPSTNTWNNGYPSGGNYWNDYIGEDEKSGSNQDEPGSDDIGDTPYVIDEKNIDRYPFFFIIAVEITNVSISKSVTNDTVTYLAANVTSENVLPGLLPFNVSAYYDETLIGTKTVSELKFPGDSMIVTFRWNTTTVPLGKYRISFTIPLYSHQRYFAGNVSEVLRGEIIPDGIIKIRDLWKVSKAFDSSTIREDINCDGNVDEIDLSIIYWAFGSYYDPEDPHPRWNPDADLNGDDQINNLDIAGAARAFGTIPHPRWNPDADVNNDRKVGIGDMFIIAKNFHYEYPWEDP